MKKKNVKGAVITVLSLLLIIVIFAFIFNNTSNSVDTIVKPSYPSYDSAFYIEDYYIEVEAKTDRTFDIKEKITVYYKVPRSVLLRDIPVNNGEKIRNVKVENFDYLNSYFDLGFYTLELGQEFPKNTGLRTYEFSYTLVTPTIKDHKDSLYLNIIGGGWPEIKNIEILLTYPTKNIISKTV